jgi:hypothetical protein
LQQVTSGVSNAVVGLVVVLVALAVVVVRILRRGDPVRSAGRDD